MEVLVIGGGMAGLAAAERLAREGLRVTLLEARDRLGGRLLTVQRQADPFPYDLGAEFVHGERVALWQVISAAGLKTQEVSDRHWLYSDGCLREEPAVFDRLEEIFSAVNLRAADCNFRAFLTDHAELSSSARAMSIEYVEGFHAADPDRLSSHSVARSERAAGQNSGTRQFRLVEGYGSLLDWFKDQITRAGVAVRLGRTVEEIRWRPGLVEVAARCADRVERFTGCGALITLPVGVLKRPASEGVRFSPKLPEKVEALHGLEMGPVVKVVLGFRRAFWTVRNFGFIHAPGQRFPTWWSDERGTVLTAWAGGPRAKAIQQLELRELRRQALGALAQMFDADPAELDRLCLTAHTQDWNNDPYSRGAYSYCLAGASHTPMQLAGPVKSTLFFAGEATAPVGDQGTVHGALESGWRAASEMIGALVREGNRPVADAA